MLDPVFVSKLRMSFSAFLFFVIYGIIVLVLWQIQVRNSGDVAERMRKQYVRDVALPAVRGRILTSDGGVLAGNRPSYSILFHTREMRQPGSRRKTVRYLAEAAVRTARAIGRKEFPKEEEISAQLFLHRGEPLTVFEELTERELASAVEFSSSLPGMEIVCTPVRSYPWNRTAGNLIGYLRSAEPLSAAGLEYAFDTWSEELLPGSSSLPGIRKKHPLLRGVPGRKQVFVDPRGFVREDAGTAVLPENGKDIVLTLDLRMQKIAEELMTDLTGVFLLLDAGTGEILVMVSSPSYSPSEFVPRISQERFRSLLRDPRHPMLNRAVRGEYSPGSIIKPLMAIALLENGWGYQDTLQCDGATFFGNTLLRCWILRVTGGGHGTLDLREALTVSCNDFFVESGLHLGLDTVRETYASAGIGRKCGFPLTEGTGRLPDRSHRKHWKNFDTALVSIGQGDVLVTPLQAAVYIAAIANGGTRYVPHILKKIVDPEGNTVFTQEPVKAGKLAASPEHLAYVRSAMRNAVTAGNGSARHAANGYVELGGKTGTAELGGKISKNVWFAGFGRLPSDGRVCSVIVFVENGTSGGKTAAPVAGEFFARLGRILPKREGVSPEKELFQFTPPAENQEEKKADERG